MHFKAYTRRPRDCKIKEIINTTHDGNFRRSGTDAGMLWSAAIVLVLVCLCPQALIRIHKRCFGSHKRLSGPYNRFSKVCLQFASAAPELTSPVLEPTSVFLEPTPMCSALCFHKPILAIVRWILIISRGSHNYAGPRLRAPDIHTITGTATGRQRHQL